MTHAPFATVVSRVSDRSDEVTELIGLLWSPNQVTRDGAKESLVQLNEASVKPLLDLLRDLIYKNEPQFETGKEAEGKKFLKRHYQLPSENQAAEIDRVMAIEISWRIKQDLVEVLRRLKAREAVPLLIDALYSGIQAGSGTHERKSAEMEMLIQFGSIAVVDLNQAIETAENNMESEPNDASWTQEENQLFKIGRTQSRQARLAMVIGEIGDPRSLPVLESLLVRLQEKGNRGYTTTSIEKAIAQIRAKK